MEQSYGTDQKKCGGNRSLCPYPALEGGWGKFGRTLDSDDGGKERYQVMTERARRNRRFLIHFNATECK